jgi:beta-glucosidase
MSKKQVFINNLLKEMTLAEKVGQLNLYNGTWEFTGPVPADDDSQLKLEHISKGMVGGMLNVFTAKGTREAQKMAVEQSRLGVPLIFGYDVIHGYKTMAPIPLAQAASWDPEVARNCAALAALEASSAGIHWTFAPMIDITRDPRWGRMMEGPGEDPYLGAVMAKAWVQGFQGDDLARADTIAACAKHFAAYGFSEAGRDYNTVDIGLSTLYNLVLPPFQAAAEAGVATFMNGFNELDGVPVTGSQFLQRQILKGKWDWRGLVVSDWASIAEMITHGYVADLEQAAEKAMQAGCDMDMESRAYVNHLEKLVCRGKIEESLIDDAVNRILRIKFDLGLFDDPYRYCDEQREQGNMSTTANLETTRDAAKKSIVLLKNEHQLLPLSKSGIKIGVIGALANDKDVPLGSWRAQADANSAISLLEGLISLAGPENIRYAKGYRLTTGKRSFLYELDVIEEDESGFEEALAVAKSSDVVVLALGEDCWQSGEGRSQADIGLKGSQQALFEQLRKVNNRIIVVMMSGRSLAIPSIAEGAAALLQTWHLGSEAGNAIAEVIFGDYNPSGKLPVSFPRHGGQVPVYYNHKNTGRPTTNPHDEGMVFWSHYTDMPNTPLFPFGFGLSYSKFEYSEFRLSKNIISRGESTQVSVMLKNTGGYDGNETVQLYIRDHVANTTRPVKELKGFEKVFLQAGEEKEITFEIDEAKLSYYQSDGNLVCEPGIFTIMAGGNSQELLMQDLQLVEK